MLSQCKPRPTRGLARPGQIKMPVRIQLNLAECAIAILPYELNNSQ